MNQRRNITQCRHRFKAEILYILLHPSLWFLLGWKQDIVNILLSLLALLAKTKCKYSPRKFWAEDWIFHVIQKSWIMRNSWATAIFSVYPAPLTMSQYDDLWLKRDQLYYSCRWAPFPLSNSYKNCTTNQMCPFLLGQNSFSDFLTQ